MTTFQSSEWSDPVAAKEYRDNADHLIQDRHRLIQLLVHFFQTFVGISPGKCVLDLGCGDGILGFMLKSCDPSIHLTAWDGSPEMISSAQDHMAKWPDVLYKVVTFDDIIKDRQLRPSYDCIVSGFAIHHAAHDEKRALFSQIHQLLKQNGFFINMDTTLPDHALYRSWYDEIWRNWLRQRKEQFQLDEDIVNIPEIASAKTENKFEPLSVQLRFLGEVGFRDVACHYQVGLFSMYGGRK